LHHFFKNPEEKIFASKIRKITGSKPSNIRVYILAFTHKTSATKTHKGVLKEDNERLEFLGDAVLDLVIAEFLFSKFPYKDEGFLTEMRSKMVSRDKLGKIAVKLGLQEVILFDKSMINKKDALQYLGGNALEALIGAYYLDKGYNKTVKFIKKKIIEPFLDLNELQATEISYKGRLFEYIQKNKKSIRFDVVREFKKNKETFFEINLVLDNEILATDIHNSKKKAEEMASEKAFKKLMDLGLIQA
jgi:ribonuclease-3